MQTKLAVCFADRPQEKHKALTCSRSHPFTANNKTNNIISHSIETTDRWSEQYFLFFFYLNETARNNICIYVLQRVKATLEAEKSLTLVIILFLQISKIVSFASFTIILPNKPILGVLVSVLCNYTVF